MNETPGPGAYEPASFNTVRYSIGKGKRMENGIAKKLASKMKRIKKREEALALSGKTVKSQKIRVNFENFGNVSRTSDKVAFRQRDRTYLAVGKFDKMSHCLVADNH